jgi:histidinol-phosphate aminotransferase
MKYAELANDGVQAQPIYEPGKSIEVVAREHGLNPDLICKLASNENPFGPSPKAVAAGQKALKSAHLYPDGSCYELRQKIAEKQGISPDSILVGNGSNELIELLGHLFLRPGLEAVMGSQAFIVYKLVTRLFGAKPVEVPMVDFGHDLEAMLAAVSSRTRLLFVASPNNPTGIANTEADLLALVEQLPEHVILCLDEAYAEYLEHAPDMKSAIQAGRKVICLRTFSKIYGLGGLRIGYAYAAPELIDLLHRVRQPFNVNSIAQAAASAALDDEDFISRCRDENENGRKLLTEGLNALGLETTGGAANFVLSRVGKGVACFETLQQRGIIVRPLAAYSLPEYVRITIGTRKENEKVLAVFKDLRESGELRNFK